MPTQRKIETVASLTAKLTQMQLTVVADYRGLTVAEMTDLRKKLRANGADLVVAKNTLIRLAARETKHEALEPLLAGPTALAIAYDDVASVAKTLNDFIRVSKKMAVRGGLLGSNAFAAAKLEEVAKLPSRQQLLAQILGGIQAPVAGVVGVLNAAISNVVYTLQARIEQLQPAEDSAGPA